MKITKFKRALSVLLVAVMIISTLPLNAMGLDEMERSTRPADSTNNIFEDLFWELIKPFIKPKVTVKGLPENAEGGIEIVTDPFSSKAKSSLGTFLDFYDIKAKDKTTGEIVHPEGEVEVTIKDARIKQNQSVFLIHVLDDENVIKNADNVTLITEAAFVSAFKDAAKAAENALGKSGTVAIEIINPLSINGRDITFKTDSFSIFIIVDDNGEVNPEIVRRTYEFLSGVHAEDGTFVQVENDGGDKYAPYEFYNKAGKKVTNQILKNGEYLEEITKPDTTTRQTFVGWYTVESFDAETGKVVWGENSTEVKFGEDNPINDITQNETVYVAAKYKKAYFASFHEYIYGHKNANDQYDYENIKTKLRVSIASGETGTINISGITAEPLEPGKVFVGWVIVTRTDKVCDEEYTEEVNAGKFYQTIDDNGNTIPNVTITGITGDIELYPKFDNAHYLRFVSGALGSGASYVAAKYVIATTVLDKLTVPTRSGYTFDGWYYDQQFTASQKVTDGQGNVLNQNALKAKLRDEDVTLYAKWIGNNTTYKVAVWYEHANDDGFSLNSLTEESGVAGNETNVTASNNVPGFTLQTPIANRVISGDGSTIVNVYYKRVIYQVNFYEKNSSGYTYVAATDNDGDQYGYVNGSFVLLTRGDSHQVVRWRLRYIYTADGWGGYRIYQPTKTYTSRYNVNNGQRYDRDTNYGAYDYSGDRFTRSGNSYNNYTYTITTSESGSLFGIDANNAYVELDSESTTEYTWTYSIDGQTYAYDGTRYNYSYVYSGNILIPELTISAKYGADIYDKWPSLRTDLTSNYPSTWYVSANGAAYVTGIEQMPLNGMSYYRYNTSGRYTLSTVFRLQDIDGSNNFSTIYKNAIYNSDSNTAYKTADDYIAVKGFRVNANSEEDAEAIRNIDGGDDNAVYEPAFRRSVAIGTRYSDGERTGNTYTLNFYYLRNKYTITFVDDSEGATPSPIERYYQADISNDAPDGYYDDNGEPIIKNVNGVPCTFAGWYDNEARIGTPYSFEGKTMPADNITLYAKWEPVYYLVKFDPDGGELKANDRTYNWFRHGQTIEAYEISRNYVPVDASEATHKYICYDYDLWVEAGHNPWDEYQSLARTAMYVDNGEPEPSEGAKIEYNFKSEPGAYTFLGWFLVDDDGNVSDEPYVFGGAVTSNLTLRARWKRLGTYNITYNPTDENNISGDIDTAEDNGYADQATTSIMNDPTNVTDGYVFKGWAIVGDTSGKLYRKGETFVVDSKYANAQRTITLQAVYEKVEDSDEPVPVTFIKFDTNYPDDAGLTHATFEEPGLQINRAYNLFTDLIKGRADSWITAAREKGYDLIGWSTDPNADPENPEQTGVFVRHDADVQIGMDNFDRDPDPNTTANTLYGVWKLKKYDVEVDKVLVNKGVDDDTWNAHPFTVHYKYELEGYDTVEGTLTVKANDTTLPKIQNIPHGAKLTVWEVLDTNDAKIFTTDHDTSSKFEITSVTAEKDGDLAATVTITNTRKDVDLYIRKFVDLDKDANKPFRFNVTVTNGTYEGSPTESVTSAKTGATATPTKITVPYGSTVTVSEVKTDTYETYNGTPYTVDDIFNTTGAADWTVTATEEQTHDFTNVRRTVKIYVTKDVVDSLDPADSDYLFKFTINGEERSAKAGETTDFVEVPIGTEVTVVETDKNGNYITEWAIYGSEETKTESDTANIGQRYGDTTVIFTNTREKVPLTIIKTVDKDVDNGKEFYFDVTINGTTEKKTVKGGESITINVMYGAPVSITERINDEYNGTGYTVAQLFKTDAAKSADHLTAATEWTFNNVRRVGTLTVTKEVVSDYAPDYTNKKYDFTYTVNGGTAVPFSITIDGNKTNTYKIPVNFFVGDVVVVTEDDLNDEYMTQSDAVTVTIAEGDGNTAKITNTRKDVTVTVIKKLAEEDSFNTDKNFTFKINGVEKTATVGGANAVFTLTYGTEFTLEEIGLDAKYDTPTFETTAGASVLTGSNGSYTAMGDGTITVTNKVKRIPVTVKKTVNGDADDKAAYYNFTVSSSIGSVTSDAEGKTAITTLVIKGDNEKTVYVPYGATLTATETGGGVNGREYKTTINGVETKTHTTGTLTAEGTTIEFVNTRIVTVTVVKAVSEADKTLVGSDKFAVTVDGNNVAEDDKSFNISLTTQNKTFKVPYNSTFTVTESLGDLAWKYQTPEYSGGSNTYTVTADTTVTITNKLQTYKVKVIKSVSDPNYYANGTKFYFEQTGLPTDDPFTLGLGRDGEDPKSVEFTVKAGTVVTVKERPGDETKSTTFTLTTGVTSTSSEYPSFTVKQDTDVEFTNVINVYPVTVKKVIDNSALDPDFAELTDNFKLEYEVYDANGVKITEVKGDNAVDLKPGVDTVIPNVPYGGYVKVNEISDDRYTTTYKSGDKTDVTCAEVKNDQTVITVTNTRKATSLTIEKIVDSTVEADKETREYVFTVMIGTVEKTVTIRGEGTGMLPGLPVGESVAVTEAEQANMDTTSEHVSYTLAEDAESNKSTFTNKRRVVTITVEKTVVSRVKADYGKDYTFSYEYTVDDKYEGTAAISIAAKPDDAKTLSGTTTISVPEGATAFKLTEDTVDANLTVTHSNNEINGPITAAPTDKVTVTNERPEIPVTIEKVVKSDINDYSNYGFMFDYTVKFGDETIETGTKTITGAGSNSEITVPKGADITVAEQTGVRYKTFNNDDFTVAQVFDTTYSNGMEAANTLTGVVAEGGKITVTNTRKLVEVTVKKVVDNKWNIASDLTKEFSFKFDSAKMYTGADYATVITSADTKKLAHNGEIKIKVPFGATFKATETEDPAFDTTVKIGSADAVKALSATTAQLTADGTVITFTNTRKTIKVEVQKHVNKFFDEDINETFHFEAAVMFGGSAWALPTAADRAFDLMDYLTDNTRKHVFEVPYGSNIQVKEVNHTGFTSTATLDGKDYDQNMTATPLTQDATVIIKNGRDRVTITVTKTVATDAKLKTVDEAINFPFTYSWTKNENFKRGETSFTLHHGQEAYTFTVPVGAAVNVNELTDTELTVYNDLKISDVFTTVSKYGETNDDQTVSFNADAATTVAFTNTHKTVNVNLVKEVNLAQDKNVDFEFTWSAVYGTDVDFTTDNGKATRNHNTTATLLCTVPVGVTISVTEILPSEQGFVTPDIAYTTGAAGTVDGAVVTISDIKADATITYTNNRQVFDITFGKKVVNGVANDNEFPFRFTYTDNGGEEHEVFISDKGSITIPKVPYGHEIVITEDVLNQLSAYGNFKVADIFTTTISDQSGIISGQSGNCTVDGAKVTITVKNNENITFTNTHKTSTVTITKTVESKNESDKQHEFPFNATAHAGDTYVIGTAGEKDSFVLKHGNTKVYTVPYGFEFTVGEEPDTRYNTSIKFDGTSEAAQVKSFTVAKDAYTIAYLNERAQGDLKIVKTGVGETTDAFLFKVTKNNDATFKPLFVTIHGNGSVYVMQLEAGDYKVEEVTDWSWRYDKQTEEITNEAEGADKTDNMATIMGGESGDKAPTVTFKNEKNNKNWLGTECGSDNKYDPQLTAAVDQAAEQVAWDSKIRLAYASPADKFRDNKETA